MSGAAVRDTFGARATLEVDGQRVTYYRLERLHEEGIADVSRLPFSIRVILEAILRGEDGHQIREDDVVSLAKYQPKSPRRSRSPTSPRGCSFRTSPGCPPWWTWRRCAPPWSGSGATPSGSTPRSR